MKKYTEQAKLSVVEDYCSGSAGHREVAHRHGVNGAVPIDNNQIENLIRPWALGRSNWLFAGSLRSGKRASAVMSLIQSARMNGHDPYASLKDVLTRLPTQRAGQVTDLLPHNWQSIIPNRDAHSLACIGRSNTESS